MLFRTKASERPFHYGPFPLEVLPRDPEIAAGESGREFSGPTPADEQGGGLLAEVARRYRDLFDSFRDGEVAEAQAPVPDDPVRRAIDLKGGAYFLDAAQVGICRTAQSVWREGHDLAGHAYALVILVEHGRVPEPDNPAHAWVAPAIGDIAVMRAGEIAACAARYVRQLGFAATAHVGPTSQVDLDQLSVLAGLCVRDRDRPTNPFLGSAYALAAVTSAYEMATDAPLAGNAAADAGGLRYWFGINGAESGRERARRAGRPSHASRYPMEQVRRVDRPTTLILDDEVPRVPKRAAFFERALKGDLGAKTQAERGRFALKQPFSAAMAGPIRAMVPLQDGPVAETDPGAHADPAANARAIKSLSYALGADLTGICEVPDYAWFSHKEDGTPIEPYHRYAVVMLIDQGYDTMEAASGDDWISGAQSMRSYMRGAEIAGVMAELVRGLGFPARAQTNIDSDVLHIPLIL